MSSSSSSATVRVEKATSDLLIGPDWTMNMDICDSINNNHWQAKDVVKAVKKRLQHKNPKVQFLALTLLETMIKNCGDYVHFQVAERDILQEMTKIVRKKTDMQVREKILVLLDCWQEAFGGPGGKYPQYYLAYVDLKRSGVQFPQHSPDSALIFTPPVTHPTSMPGHPQAGHGMPSSSSLTLDEAMTSEMANLSLSDLDSIRSAMELLSDMLKAVNPNDHGAVQDDVIMDLISQCRSNQKKLMRLLNSTGDEELLGQGLELNDHLQNLLSKHDAIALGSPLPSETSETLPKSSIPVVSAPVVTNRFEDDEEEDDGDFAQLAHRKLKPNPAATQSTAAESGVYPSSLNCSDATTTSSSTEVSSSTASNALELPDPPPSVKTVTKEQDMIDLLSLTLSSNPSPPHTPPVTPPSISNQNGPPPSALPNGQGYPYNPQPYTLNQGYFPQNSYAAPWAQPQPQPQVPQFQSSYPPPPWEAPTTVSPNPFMSSNYQVPASANTRAPAAYVPMHASRPLQLSNSSGAGVKHEVQVNASPPPAAAKPYVLSNRLFEDLVDLRNADGSLKTSNSSPRFSGPSDHVTTSGMK